MGLLDTIRGLLGSDLPPPPLPPVAGAKRKASEDAGRHAKARRVNRPASEAPYLDDNYEDAGLLDGTSGQNHLRRGAGTSFDAGYINSGQTLLERPRQVGGRPGIMRLVGQEQDTAGLLQGLHFSERDEDVDQCADKLLEKVDSPKSRRASAGQQRPRAGGASPDAPTVQPPTPSDSMPISDSEIFGNVWQVRPNKVARKILGKIPDQVGNKRKVAGEIIKAKLEEPECVLRDAEIRDAMWEIMTGMSRFARRFFDFKSKPKDNDLRRRWGEEYWANGTHEEKLTMIRCIASSGPGGFEAWHDMYHNPQKRRALVCAIIGKVFVQQVYQHPFFGATEEQEELMADLEERLKDEDGFQRKLEKARRVRELIVKSYASIALPKGFDHHVKAIVDTLYTHLKPFIAMSPKPISKAELLCDLYKLTAQAGVLSLLMLVDPHTVYYFKPVFKEDNYNGERMECFNQEEMEDTHPRTRKSWPAHYTEQEKVRAKTDEAVTQIVIHDGLTAYRVGGWETKESTPRNPVYCDEEDQYQGIRSRVLVPGWVYCRWGQSRSAYGGKARTDETIHGMQWKDPGFVDFMAKDPRVERRGTAPSRMDR